MRSSLVFFFNDTATPEIYTLSLHDALPICLEQKLLVNCTQQTILRLLPAMTLPDEQAHEGLDILTKVLQAA